MNLKFPAIKPLDLSFLKDFSLSDLKQVQPSKNALNIVAGFDCVYKQVRIMRVFGLDFANAVVQNFSYSSPFLSEEFLTEFKQIFDEYFKTLPTSHSLACYVVLPDNAVVMEDISLPAMKQSKIKAAINAQLQNDYKNIKELQYNHFLVGHNRQYIVYYVTLLKKSYLTNVYRCMAISKLYPKASSYSANCTLNAVLHFKPAYRRRSFVFLDIKADYTKVVLCVKGRTAGFAHFMLGYTHLKDDKVLQENMQYDHDVADLAIINAKERAKMKALTVDAEPEDLADVADSVAEQLIEGVNKNEQFLKDGENAESGTVPESVAADVAVSQVLAEAQAPKVNPLESAVQEIVAEPDFDPDAEADELDEEQAEEERRERLMREMQEARRKKVFARKMPKRLPKFMLRPVPETPEGIMYENFRMIVKWALLYADQMKRQEYLPNAECVLVNISEKYRFLIDMANAEEEKSEIPFEALESLGGENIDGSLDLFGALYTGMYNKRQNF